MVNENLVEIYARRIPLLHELARVLEQKTVSALEDVAHIDRVTFRVKDLNSFNTKAQDSKYSDPLTQVEDQVAGRVITFFRDDIEVVRGRLTKWFGSVEHVVKEPVGPEEFGYESDHLIFIIAEHWKPSGWQALESMPATFEFQIRTLFMHAWAEPQHDLGYKGLTDRTTKRELAWIAASAWGADRTFNEIVRRMNP